MLGFPEQSNPLPEATPHHPVEKEADK